MLGPPLLTLILTLTLTLIMTLTLTLTLTLALTLTLTLTLPLTLTLTFTLTLTLTRCSTTAPFASRLEEMREDFAWLQENVFDAAPAVFPPAVFSWDAYVEARAIAFSP